jgi:hypothetical protein
LTRACGFNIIIIIPKGSEFARANKKKGEHGSERERGI